jgi:hypothetical protein
MGGLVNRRPPLAPATVIGQFQPSLLGKSAITSKPEVGDCRLMLGRNMGHLCELERCADGTTSQRQDDHRTTAQKPHAGRGALLAVLSERSTISQGGLSIN